MSLGTFLAFVVGALLGVGLARMVKNRGVAKIRVRRDMSVPPERIIKLVGEVEREPKMIPFVKSTEVLARRGDSVRYRATFGFGEVFWAVYTKSTHGKKRRVEWHSESGAFGLAHFGMIRFRHTAQGNRAELTTEYSLALPVIGPLVVMVTEWLVAGAMFAWLRNLDREALKLE